MADFLLPISFDFPDYEFKSELEGTVYTFRFRWNSRLERWMMDIKTSEGGAILLALPVNINTDLKGRFPDPRLPPGSLIAINIEAENEETTRNNFGSDVLLFYRETA